MSRLSERVGERRGALSELRGITRTPEERDQAKAKAQESSRERLYPWAQWTVRLRKTWLRRSLRKRGSPFHSESRSGQCGDDAHWPGRLGENLCSRIRPGTGTGNLDAIRKEDATDELAEVMG